MDSLASQSEALSPLVSWSCRTHKRCSDARGEVVRAGRRVCQRGWSCPLAHCFTDGDNVAQRKGLPMGPGRLVAEPEPGS